MSTNYEFWLTYNAEAEKLRIPVLPEMVTIKCGSNNSAVNVAGLGGITIKQDRPAYEFSWSSFFPATPFPGVQVDKLKKPKELVDQLLEWKNGTLPVHFIATALGLDVYCTIELFEYSESGGDVGTYQYSISLKEYREVTVRKVKLKTSGGKKKATTKKKSSKTKKRTNNKKKEKTYKVKKGDTLWAIAKKYYGSGSKYTKIYKANKKKIGGNPNNLKIGTVLSIPS